MAQWYGSSLASRCTPGFARKQATARGFRHRRIARATPPEQVSIETGALRGRTCTLDPRAPRRQTCRGRKRWRTWQAARGRASAARHAGPSITEAEDASTVPRMAQWYGSSLAKQPGVTLYARLCARRSASRWCPPLKDAHVMPSCASPPELPRDYSVSDVEICMAKCAEEPTCRSVQHRGGSCQYCSADGSTTREEVGVTVYTQLCEPPGSSAIPAERAAARWNTGVGASGRAADIGASGRAADIGDWCPPQENTHASPSCSSPYSLPWFFDEADVEACKKKCASHPDCRAIQYRRGGCQYCSTNGSATRQMEGVTLYTRLCGGGQKPDGRCTPKEDGHVTQSCSSPRS